jgi:ribulose-phosphate 3-epimerase
MQIVPSIIAKNFEEVKQKIAQIDGLVTWAQLDIMDGNFVLPVTWSTADDLANLDGQVKIEAHLMIDKPEDELKQWMTFADRVLIQVEATDYLADIIESFDGAPIKLGVVLKLDTPLEVLDDFVGKIEYVQLMSIDTLGYYGGKFDEKIYERIKIVRALYPEMLIGVDGGITLDNAPKLIEAGANNLVVGSAIWESGNISEAIKQFQALG